MKNRLLSLIVVLAAVLGAACSSPTAPPKIELCFDQNAQNYNQPAPCVPKPAPAESWVQLDAANADPKPGTTLTAMTATSGSFDNTNSVLIPVKFGISEADKAEAQAAGHNFSIVLCLLTKDKKEVPGACALTNIIGQMTETKHRIMVFRNVTDVTETHFARVRLVMAPPNTNFVSKVFKEEVYDLFYGWKTP